MQWTEKRLARLKEVNDEKKVSRYFAIKKLVEEMIGENQRGLVQAKPTQMDM